MRAPSRRHMLIPKGKHREKPFPAVPEHCLPWLAGRLAPIERKALQLICETADLVVVDEGHGYLIVPVTGILIDILAAFEAEGEDRENDLEDEPMPDDEPSIGDGRHNECELDEADLEPDYHNVRDYGMDQTKPLSTLVR